MRYTKQLTTQYKAMRQNDLFDVSQDDQAPSCELIKLDDQELILHPDFLDDDVATAILLQLRQELSWQQPCLAIAGKSVPIPRLQVWMGDKDSRYTYSGKTFDAEPWHPKITVLKTLVEQLTDNPFNSALCNLYRNGQDSVAWHADDETELGNSPCVASLSLGETRTFQLKRKDKQGSLKKIELTHNSLLIMKPGVQEHWLHRVPKTLQAKGTRINITFRLLR